jgi:hypothetical protein
MLHRAFKFKSDFITSGLPIVRNDIGLPTGRLKETSPSASGNNLSNARGDVAAAIHTGTDIIMERRGH